MNFRKLLNLAGATAIASALALSAQAKDLTMLTSWGESYNAVPVFAVGFAKRVEELSDGEVKIDLRGPETVPPFEQLQPVSSGLFDMLFTHGAYHKGQTAMVFGMDAIEDDPVKRRESGIYDLIDQHYNKRGLKLIGVFSAASGYHVLLREPIGESGDLSGLKIRASGTYHHFVKELGGSVVTMPASEIYGALERGVVDGAAWPVFGALDYKWYEVADYMARPTFGVTNLSLFMNLDSWNALSDEEQDIFIEAAKQLEIEGREHFEMLWAEEEAELKRRGMEITEFGPDVAPRVDAVFNTGVWQDVVERSGEDGRQFRDMAIEKGLTEQ
ncbi:TRAP transporter substrate-binding protein DctP [Ferruginivarius sediminum]|uniref:C4-dicarboxylate ABC transporter substrate-binding protein n=1 Tax=Ferruginivarius sediminum TaxID=2661937 RepID=A0A369TBY9_9PROT|nr:TRAP transporter substrate-binding protein DctP [Ferruginivarius sediminum]RDD60436.1 C4-dicarboxylate ABC transporter substrate-binding protein [Ferruginivarius sediminum]